MGTTLTHPTTPRPAARSAADTRPRVPRLTITSVPSLDPVKAASLTLFFDTVFTVASRLVLAGEPTANATAA